MGNVQAAPLAQVPLGQTLLIDNATAYTVTGVFEEIPTNATLRIDIAAPFASLPFYADVADMWDSSFIETYVLLAPGAGAAALESQFPGLIARICSKIGRFFSSSFWPISSSFFAWSAVSCNCSRFSSR